MNSTIEIVIITFKYDIPQLYLLFLSIKKHLDKHIRIKIIVNYNNKVEYNSLSCITLLAKKHLAEFSFTVIEKPQSIPASGWIGQQILKWYAAYTSDCPWQMVIDSKNFFIRKFNFSDIDFSNNNIPGFPIENKNDTWSITELERSFDFIKEHQNIYPQRYAAMTPWIWKTGLIKEMLDTLWPNLDWQKLNELPGTEWFLYISWAAGKVHYFPKQFVTGVWGIGNSSIGAFNGLRNENICFWTKHRFAIDDLTISVTKNVLREFNIATNKEIKIWLRMIKDIS